MDIKVRNFRFLTGRDRQHGDVDDILIRDAGCSSSGFSGQNVQAGLIVLLTSGLGHGTEEGKRQP